MITKYTKKAPGVTEETAAYCYYPRTSFDLVGKQAGKYNQTQLLQHMLLSTAQSRLPSTAHSEVIVHCLQKHTWCL